MLAAMLLVWLEGCEESLGPRSRELAECEEAVDGALLSLIEVDLFRTASFGTRVAAVV